MPYNLNDTSVKYSELERAAKEISNHLPEWKFIKEGTLNCLKNNEYCIYIREDKKGTRINISASHYLDKSLGEERSSNDHYFGNIINDNSYTMEITVSASKEPDAIAKDIQRRLIPDYIELYEKCKKIYLVHRYEVDQRIEFAKKAAAILGCNPPQIPNTQNQFLNISHHLTIDNQEC